MMIIIGLLIKIYLYFQDPNEAKYQYFFKKCKINGFENLKDPQAFIEYGNNLQDVYKNVKDYNPSRKCNVLIVYDDMITDIISSEQLNHL